MMVKVSKLPGTKVVKSYSELFKHVAEEMRKIHDNVHNSLKHKASTSKAVR